MLRDQELLPCCAVLSDLDVGIVKSAYPFSLLIIDVKAASLIVPQET